jgi:hypothetical protein
VPSQNQALTFVARHAMSLMIGYGDCGSVADLSANKQIPKAQRWVWDKVFPLAKSCFSLGGTRILPGE